MCRGRYEEGDREPPCEEKGNCITNAVELLAENVDAMEFWFTTKNLGGELAAQLTTIKLTPYEAEELTYKLNLIDDTINEFRQAEQERS